MSLALTRVLERDAEIVSTKKDRYVTENQFQYRLVIKTWFAMIPDDTLVRTLTAIMNDHGLIKAIHLMAKAGDIIVSELSGVETDVDAAETSEDRLISQLVAGVKRCSPNARDRLQIARYPKRFQPVDADLLEASTLSRFKVGLNDAKLRNRKDLTRPGYVNDILDRAKELLTQVMGSAAMTYEDIIDYGHLTPGKDPYDIKLRADKLFRSRFLAFPTGHDYVFTSRTPRYTHKEILENGIFKVGSPESTERIREYWLCKLDKEPTYLYAGVTTYIGGLEFGLDRINALVKRWRKIFPNTILLRVKRGVTLIPLSKERWCPRSKLVVKTTNVKDVQEIKRSWNELKEPVLSHWGPVVDWWGTSIDEFNTIFSASVEVVPKNSKTGRVIAREECTRQWFLTAIREFTYRNMRKWYLKQRLAGEHLPLPVTPEDQSPNQLLAYLSSIDDKYATIDWSEASDRISYILARRVLPTKHFRLRAVFRSRFLRIDGKLCVNHYWATMGAANTWSDMSYILWAIAEAVRESVIRLADLDPSDVPHCRVFGDDTVLATVVAETFIQVMESLGMKCNLEKSFISGPYRESCGVEVVNGDTVETNYWPRRALRVTREAYIPETYAALCDLQHKFFDWPDVAVLFDTALRDIAGERYTSCEPLTDRLEPWSYAPVYDVAPNSHYDPDRMPKQARDQDVVAKHLVVQNKLPSLPKDLYTNPKYSTYLEYKYVEYLRLGPSLSSDPICRSLGLTESRLRPGDFSSGKLTLEKLEFTD